MNYGSDKLVFMTLNYLLRLNRSLLGATKEKDGEWKQKRNLTLDQYTRTPNCLFVWCSYNLTDLDRIEGDRPFKL